MVSSSNSFISVDWGTSRLRMHHIVSGQAHPLHSFESGEGIKHIFERAQLSDQGQRNFFLAFLKKCLYSHFPSVDAAIPIVISGMASSSIGVVELPYAKTPFSCDGTNAIFREIEHDLIPNRILVISGVATKTDVMRGEETQIIGLSSSLKSSGSRILILPGTHSKHIFLEQNQMTNFETYLTGELFEILAHHSILKNSMVQSKIDDEAILAIRKGAHDGSTPKLLNHLFEIRASDLLSQRKPTFNFHYLSGLLISAELINILSVQASKIILAASQPLADIYQTVAMQLGLHLDVVSQKSLRNAVIHGQQAILNHLLSK